MTVKCHEFFGCPKLECPMFNEDEERDCWEIEPSLTPCTASFSDSLKLEEKHVYCKNCLYYEHANPNDK